MYIPVRDMTIPFSVLFHEFSPRGCFLLLLYSDWNVPMKIYKAKSGGGGILDAVVFESKLSSLCVLRAVGNVKSSSKYPEVHRYIKILQWQCQAHSTLGQCCWETNRMSVFVVFFCYLVVC